MLVGVSYLHNEKLSDATDSLIDDKNENEVVANDF